MKSNVFKFLTMLFISTLILSACKKEKIEPDEYALFEMGISDAKSPYIPIKEHTNPILLTKCEITISNIQLINNTENYYVESLHNEVTVDLLQFQGTVQELLSIYIPVGSYTSVKISVSGVSTTYDGNNYTAAVGGGASVTLEDVPGFTFTEFHGVINAFASGPITFELPLEFTLDDPADVESVRLFFDAESSTFIVSFSYSDVTYEFAGIRALPNVAVILEEGIQQIKHSPPISITVDGDNIDYYGIHTFVDFNAKGGTINSHTSQHVYRGEDGSLLINAEDMATNPNPLSSATIHAEGETGITADETFRFSQIKANLAGAGHTLDNGKTYYFSLRKTWNITTDGKTYDLTRICEPVPVTIPDIPIK
jgi:hypothetical protein